MVNTAVFNQSISDRLQSSLLTTQNTGKTVQKQSFVRTVIIELFEKAEQQDPNQISVSYSTFDSHQTRKQIRFQRGEMFFWNLFLFFIWSNLVVELWSCDPLAKCQCQYLNGIQTGIEKIFFDVFSL